MTARTIAAASLSLLLAACQMAVQAARQPPLDAEGEVWVYLQPLPAGAARLDFTIESIAAVGSDGRQFPLALAMPEVSGKGESRQRLLATGRMPPGEYAGLSLRVKKGTLASEDGSPPASLLVGGEPARASVPFQVRRARALVLALSLDPGRSLDKGYGFRPALTGAVPALPVVDLLGFASSTDSDAVTVFDKQSRQVVAVLAAGRDPRGLAVDRVRGRLYVALSGGDEVAAYDVASGDELGRARLRPGDRPQELGLAADGRTLVVTCPGGNAVAFVDGPGLVEVGRANAGLRPTVLLMARDGRRAFAFNQASSNATVVDVGARTAVGSFATDGAVARAATSRSGDRMFLVSPTSPNMRVVSLPGLATLSQVEVGFGAASVLVDPRNDWIYVGMGNAGQLQVFAPQAPLPVARVDLPGPATWLAIDDAFDRLLAVIPSRNGVAAVELTSQRVLPGLDAGDRPYAVAVLGERR